MKEDNVEDLIMGIIDKVYDLDPKLGDYLKSNICFDGSNFVYNGDPDLLKNALGVIHHD